MFLLSDVQKAFVDLLCKPLPNNTKKLIINLVGKEFSHGENFVYSLTEALNNTEDAVQIFSGFDGTDVDSCLFNISLTAKALNITPAFHLSDDNRPGDATDIPDTLQHFSNWLSESNYVLLAEKSSTDYLIFVAARADATDLVALGNQCDLLLQPIQPTKTLSFNFHLVKRRARNEPLSEVLRKAAKHAKTKKLRPVLMAVCGECKACTPITKNLDSPEIGQAFEGNYVVRMHARSNYFEFRKTGLEPSLMPFFVRFDNHGKLIGDIFPGSEIYQTSHDLPDFAVSIKNFLDADKPELYKLTQEQADYAVGGAVITQDFESLKYLIEHANANLQNQETNLFCDIENDDTEMASFLLRNGADIHFDEEHRSPLPAAIRHKRFKLAHFLLSNGSNVNGQDVSGMTALHFAVSHQSMDLIYELLNAGANVNHPCGYDRIPLHYAETNIDLHRVLIEEGSNVNKQNRWGSTPLHNAIRSSRQDYEFLETVIHLYLRHGAELKIKDDEGLSVIDLLAKKDSEKMPKYLKELISSG